MYLDCSYFALFVFFRYICLRVLLRLSIALNMDATYPINVVQGNKQILVEYAAFAMTYCQNNCPIANWQLAYPISLV